MTTACPSVAPPRTLRVTLIAVSLFLTFGGHAVASNPVTRIGDYSNLATSADGVPDGFEVTLWRDGENVIGLVTFVDSREYFSHTSMIWEGTLVEDTGALAFRARLLLTARRERRETWDGRRQDGMYGRAIESIEFIGSVHDSVLSGRFSVIGLEQDERAYFEDQSVTLRRVPSKGPSSFSGYGGWLAAHEHRVGTREIAVAMREKARRAGRALQVGLSGGLFETSGLDAHFFESGGGHFTTDVYYTCATHIAVGVKVGLSRFYPNPIAVGNDVIPTVAADPVLKVPETGFLFELAPAIRVTSGNTVTDRVNGFVQASGGYYYVNLETPYSLLYKEGVRVKVKNGSVGHIGHHLGASVAAGVSVQLSRSSRLEVAPEYHRLFGDSDLSLFGVMVHFRIELLHD